MSAAVAERSLKQIGAQTLIYAIGVWAARATSFLLVPLYTRGVAKADFGLYDLLSRTFDLLSLMLPMGMVMALMRFYGLAEEGERRGVASTAILWAIGAGGLAAAAVSASGRALSGWILGDPHYGAEVMLLGLWLWFELMFSISAALLRARAQAVLYVVANASRSLLLVGASFLLLWRFRLGLTGIMLANAVASGVPAVLLTLYALGTVGLGFSARRLGELLRFGLPLLAAAVLLALSGVVDRFLLNRLMGAEQVAVFGIGAKLSVVLSVLAIAPVGLAYTPFIFSTAKRPNAPQVFARVATYVVVLTAGAMLALGLFAPELIAVLAPASYRGAIRIGQVYLIGGCLYGISSQAEIGIYLRGVTEWKVPAFGLMAAVSVALNVVLIPRYGPAGASVAYLAAQGAYLAVLYLISRPLYPVPYEWGRLGKVMIAAGVVYAAALGLVPGLRLASPASRAAAFAAAPVLLWLLRFPQREERAALARLLRSLGRATRLGVAASRGIVEE